MDREEAVELVKRHVHRTNLFKHILAVEAIIRSIAENLNDDIERWGLLGLLHDLDFDETINKPELHAKKSVDMLIGKVDDELLRAIMSHNYQHTGVKPESRMERALIAADAISGLLIACALVMPNKKLAEVKPKTVTRKFKETDFARNCNREHILYCEQLGLSMPMFAGLALGALQKIAKELDL